MSNKNFAGKETFQRMNYLYQISELTINKSHQNNVNTDRKCLEYISNYYSCLVTNIGKKAQLRIDPSIKRTICKGCERLLIPGKTATVRIRRKPMKHTKWTCLQCGSYKIFNMKNNYVLWSENPEALENTKEQSSIIENNQHKNISK